MVRARWSAQLHGTSLLRTAFAWESLIDEAVFILGPPLATIVALQVAPSAALILATTLLIIGTLLLLTQKSTEPKPSGRQQRGEGPSGDLAARRRRHLGDLRACSAASSARSR